MSLYFLQSGITIDSDHIHDESINSDSEIKLDFVEFPRKKFGSISYNELVKYNGKYFRVSSYGGKAYYLWYDPKYDRRSRLKQWLFPKNHYSKKYLTEYLPEVYIILSKSPATQLQFC